MENFDLRKYLAENKLIKEDANPIWTIDSFEDSADISDAGPEYKTAVINIIKAKHPNISDKDLEASIEVMNVTWYNESRGNAKGSEPEEMEVSAEDFADGAIEHYEDIIVWDNNNLGENKLFKENMSLEVDDDFIELSADSGDYDGDLNDDGTVDFSVVYDDGTEFDDSTWKSILGPKHAFVQISNQIPTKVEAAGDYVMITVDLEDLKKLLK